MPLLYLVWSHYDIRKHFSESYMSCQFSVFFPSCISENRTHFPVSLWILNQIQVLLKYLSWIYYHSQLLTLNLRFMNLHKDIRKKKHTWLVYTVFLFCEFLILCELSLRPFGFITSTPSLSFWGMTRPEIVSVQIKSWKPFSCAARTDLYSDACASRFYFTSMGNLKLSVWSSGVQVPALLHKAVSVMDDPWLMWICCFLHPSLHVLPALTFASGLVQQVYKDPALLPTKGKMAYVSLPQVVSIFAPVYTLLMHIF